jgi:hypothetical protein
MNTVAWYWVDIAFLLGIMWGIIPMMIVTNKLLKQLRGYLKEYVDIIIQISKAYNQMMEWVINNVIIKKDKK